MIRILIVDSHEEYRNELCEFLSNQNDFTVVGLGGDSYTAIKLADSLKPDIVLMDTNLPMGDGIKTAALIKYRSPRTSIIVNWDGKDKRVFLNIFNSISGYITKEPDNKLLCHGIRAVYYGGSLVAPEIAKKIKSITAGLTENMLNSHGELLPIRFSKQAESRIAKERNDRSIAVLPRSISYSEMQIMGYVGLGYTNKEIAKKLCLTEGTVRNYLSSVLHKTGFRDRTQVAIYAIKVGLGG